MRNAASKVATQLPSPMVQAVQNWHLKAVEEWKAKREADARARLALLRDQDFDAYLQEVQHQKSTQVAGLLESTDKCLRNLLSRMSGKLASKIAVAQHAKCDGMPCNLSWSTSVVAVDLRPLNVQTTEKNEELNWSLS